MTFIQNQSMIAVRLPYESGEDEPSGMYAWFVKGSNANHADEALRTFLNLNFEGDGLEHKVKYTRLFIPKFEVTSTIDIKSVLHEDASVFKSGNLKDMSRSGDDSECVNKFEQVCRLQVDQEGTIASVERVLFIGTQFSILYTSMYSPLYSCEYFARHDSKAHTEFLDFHWHPPVHVSGFSGIAKRPEAELKVEVR